MWTNIVRVRKKHGKAFENGRTHWQSPELAERVLAMLEREKEPTPSLELDVPAAALTGSKYWFEDDKRDKSRWPDWIARWTGRDLGFAVHALALSASFQHDDSAQDVFIRPCSPSEGLDRLGALPFTLLGRAIATASAGEYARAKAAADELLVAAPRGLRFMLAYMLPKERYATGDANWGLETTDDENTSSTCLAYALAIGADAKCVRDTAECESAWDGWFAVRSAAERVVKELDAARSLPLVRLMMVGGLWGEAMTREAKALSAIEPSLAVARVCTEMLEDHHAGAVLRPWLAARPELAIPALASAIAAARSKLVATKSLLLSLALSHRDLASATAKKLGGDSRAILERVLETTKPLADASAQELPTALATPPWRATEAKKSEPINYPKLEPLAFEERIHWGDEDPQALADAAFPPFDEPRTKNLDEKVLRKLGEKKKDWVSMFQVGALTDEAAVELLEAWGPETFYFNTSDVEGIVARFGLAQLPLAMRYAKAKADTVGGLVRVESPRLAPLMARIAVDLKKNKDAAEHWLTQFAEAAMVGLVPALAEASGKERATLEEAIRIIARESSESSDVVSSVAMRYGVEKVVSAVLASSSFAKLPKKLPKMPAFWNPKGLPRPKLARADRALPLAAVDHLGTYLALSKRGAYHPALYAIRSACDRASLARFAWALFLEWLGAGASTKDDFGFFVLGIFGDDDAARALQPMIKAWAPGGFPQRAQMGVDVLAALGTHAALEQVYKTATKVRSKALAAHAEKTLQKIALRLRLSRDDLADRLVPDLDVDARGTRTFDYGKRKLLVRFDEHFKPYVEAAGKRLADLPKPVASDDEELATEALASFKELKKKTREVISEQTKRLEQALATRRKYDQKAFSERFVDHALLRMLGARLLWGAYGKALRAAFRIEDGSFLDASGRPFELREGETVGLVHPAELDAKARATWSDVLAEHRIIQPIVQLGREVFAPEDGALKKVANKTVASTKLLGLERKLWKRGASPQGGLYDSYERSVGDVLVTLAFEPGIYLGDPKMNPEQKLGGVTLVRGKGNARLADLDVAIASELVADISSLFS